MYRYINVYIYIYIISCVFDILLCVYVCICVLDTCVCVSDVYRCLLVDPLTGVETDNCLFNWLTGLLVN